MIEEEIPQSVGSVPGHNSGTMMEQARAAQREALDDTPRDGGKTFAKRRAEFLASASKQRVIDRETAGAAADTIKLAKEFRELVVADRKDRSEPYRQVHLALSGMEAEFLQPLDDAMDGLAAQIDDYTAEEDRRVAQQRAEQQAEMARLRAETAPVEQAAPRERLDYSNPGPRAPRSVTPPRKKARITGDLGATVTTRAHEEYEIEDVRSLPDHILTAEPVKAAILAVVRSTRRHLGVPAGIRVITSTGNQIR